MKKNIILCGIVLLMTVGCSVEPTYYSQVTPDTFFTSQSAVWQRYNRPFTHWRYYIAQHEGLWMLQELGTDELCLPTRGTNWYNSAVYQHFHHHEYTNDMTAIEGAWERFGKGVALSWDAMEELADVDFDKLGFEEGTRESMLMQLQTLVSHFYLIGLDLFGGVPLYTTTQSAVKGRSTDKQTFQFIDSLLTISIPNLPLKETLGEAENSTIHRAVGAALKARLYFNAEAYIGTPMYEEAAAICQDIIDGVYGNYALDDDWTNIFGFTNETCPEIIWTVPSQYAQNETDGGHWYYQAPYNLSGYLGGLSDTDFHNAVGLTPSRNCLGELYDYKLGGVYEKFNDKDVRKKLYVYYGDGKYEGMFLIGRLVNPVDTTWVCYGAREYSGEVIEIVDQIGPFNLLGSTYATLEEVNEHSDIANGDEKSGVRLTKVSPRPYQEDRTLVGNPDTPVIRLAEIYYTLAECKMRAGDLAGAAELINTVRRRYFEDGVDPNPVTADNLDMYRMLDEWMEEFLCEGRRRTDLIRWNAYVTEDWWDHKATNNPNLNRFPLHYSTLDTNNLLEQNPGY